MCFVLFIKLLLILRICSIVRSDKMCESIIPDAITQLQNGTIVIFQERKVWFLNLSPNSQPNSLSGPCSISEIFEGMEGPVDAAVTIEVHESVTEFTGASIIFSNGNFYTFRNLRPYQVEWGDLIYLPVKGLQSKMGIADDEGKRLMPTRMRAAFFDPNSAKSKFIFADGTVLGYNFELGSEFDKPVVTDIGKELKKFGIPVLPVAANITAALTLMGSKQLVFFQGSVYCSILFDLSNLSNQKQSCYNLPVSKFLDCDKIDRKLRNCAPPSQSAQVTDTTDAIPIQVPEQAAGSMTQVANVRSGEENITTPTLTLKTTVKGSAHSLSSCRPYKLIAILVLFLVNIKLF